MANETSISQDLYDLLVTQNFDPETTDAQGKPSQPGEGTVFSFDYISSSGKNYGTAVLVVGEDNDLMFFFGDNLGRSMEEPDKTEWFKFLQQLSQFATSHRYTWSPKDLNRFKHTMAGMAAIKEGLFEGYYGTRKKSYMGEQTNARLVINHNQLIGENDKRYRHVESLFIETAQGERFKLPFKNLSGGKAMLEHVRQGGNPYDIRGQHINEIVSEMAVLSRFNRARQNRVFEGVTQELVEQAENYYQTLRENLKHLASGRGYQKYFESWSPADITTEEALVEDLKTLFVEQSIDSRIEAALPTLAKIQQGTKMKEADIFESWVEQVVEGTWALPDNPEAQAKLDELMSKELIVGPDATNATEQLYDVIGDDQLFDILNDLAERDPRANVWDDTDVQKRLEELGIQLNTTSDAMQQPEAEPAAGEELKEGHMAEVDQILQDVASGDEDIYRVYSQPRTKEEAYAAKIIGDMYDEVVIDRHLHPDDDMEKILDIVADRLEQEHSINEAVDTKMSDADKQAAYTVHHALKSGEQVSPGYGMAIKSTYNELRRKYGSNWRKLAGIEDAQGVAEGSDKSLLKQVKPYCRNAWVSNGKLWVECDPLQVKKIAGLLNSKPLSGSVAGEYAFDLPQGVAEGSEIDNEIKHWEAMVLHWGKQGNEAARRKCLANLKAAKEKKQGVAEGTKEDKDKKSSNPEYDYVPGSRDNEYDDDRSSNDYDYVPGSRDNEYDNDDEQGVAEGKGPQSKLDQKIIDLLVSGTPAKTIARKLDIPVEWVHEVSKYNMPGTEPDYSDPRNSRPANRFGEGVAEDSYEDGIPHKVPKPSPKDSYEDGIPYKRKKDVAEGLNKPPVCKNCGKKQGEHRRGECPKGTKTAIGYTDYGPEKFEPKESKQKGVAEGSAARGRLEVVRSERAKAHQILNKFGTAKMGRLEVMRLLVDHGISQEVAKIFASERQIKEQGVAEEYDPSYDPDYRPYQPPERNPDWDREAEQQRDAEDKPSTSTVTVKDLDGNVVLTFPSTGGYYGDVRIAKEKGFDTEAGDYEIKWNKGVAEDGKNEMSGRDGVWDSFYESDELARIKQLALLK